MAVRLPHETQAACIAALHAEIGRTKDILASLKPAGAAHRASDEPGVPPAVRIALSDTDGV
jgi:hypothetical protein